ncbi:MAG: glycosyl hydrolase family 88 [Spirochaetia bacterium]|nr:glycosyl hydrolase family 88 [Spirochaetia bacterium]
MQEIEAIYAKIVKKMSSEVDRLGTSIPYIPDEHTKRYVDMGEQDLYWWTNGFWPGMLWLLYHATGDQRYKQTAEGVETRLDEAMRGFTGLHHDVGFMWLHSAVANHRLTGNETSFARALHAATVLAGRYNPRGKFIRCWNDDKVGWVIVDSMMNLNLLYWASDVTGDPRFKYIAIDHADTVLEKVVREDGSCNHIVILDPHTGMLLEAPAGQGYAEGSSWSRGQGWALYGFVLSYVHTKDERYLKAAMRIASYVLPQLEAERHLPLVDFRAPKQPVRYDSTAAMIIACGLLELSKIGHVSEARYYRDQAIALIKAADEKFCNWNPEEDGMLGFGTAAYHSNRWNEVPIIYGDFFLIEAVLKILGKDFLIW